MPIGKELRFDFANNMCFGCSPHNERGLQLTFMQVAPSGVASRYTAPPHSCGAPGVVHGGLQAALLDEAIGFAVHAHHETTGELDKDEAAWQKVVTVEFDLRYRKPVPVGVEVGLRAEVVRVSGREYLAVAEIVGGDDEVLTSATREVAAHSFVTTDRLPLALAVLRKAGAEAGLASVDVEDEAAALAAAVCAEDRDAALAWGATFDRPSSGFAAAAKRGSSWTEEATPLLARALASADRMAAGVYATALADLATEACALAPDPSFATLELSRVAGSAQLRAAGVDAHPVATVAPRVASPPVAPKTDEPDKPAPTLAELLEQLDELIGLKDVKEQVHKQTALLRMNKLRADKGLKTATVSRHLVFVGNPGTGKTTVARLVAGIYRALGLLTTNAFIETDRSGLVAGFVGQTAIKTAELIKSAVGGCLFIDEAYALAEDQFGEEAISTLVKGMEDHRDELVLIVAGYPVEMAEFIATNPGLKSRFGTTINFPDYTDDELVAIFEQAATSSDFRPTDGCLDRLRQILQTTPRDKGFGNGRFVRNLFESAVSHQAWRLRDDNDLTEAEMRQLRVEDLAP